MSGQSMRSGAVAQALDTAIATHGIDPLAAPRRATAVVADLMAAPDTPSSGTVVALRATLEAIADQPDPRRKGVDRARILALVADDIEARGAADVVDAVVTTLDLRTRGAPPAPRSWRMLVGGTTAALLAVVVLVVLAGRVPGSSEDRSPPPATTSTLAAVGDPTSPGESPSEPASDATRTPTPRDVPVQPGLSAVFSPIIEGLFEVERGWRVTAGGQEFIGIVRLGSPDGEPVTGNHRELPPPAAVVDPGAITWSPEPADIVGTVGVFSLVSLAGDEVLEIQYRSPLPEDAVVTEADLLDWFDEWAPQAQRVQSTLGQAEPLVEPRIDVAD